MYRVKRNKRQITVRGPGQRVFRLITKDIGIVLRPSLQWPFQELMPYAVRCSDMTDAEIVGHALVIDSYPQIGKDQ